MKNKNIIKLFAFLWSALLIVSCSNEDLDRKDGPTVPEGLPVTMKLNVGTPDVTVVETKALENENQTFGTINNLAVLVYDENGENPIITYWEPKKEDLGKSLTSVSDIAFDAKTGNRKIYVLTNVGSRVAAEAYVTEADLLAKKEDASISPTGEEMMLGCVAESWEASLTAYEATGKVVDIQGSEKLYAKVIPPYTKITFKIVKELPESKRVYLAITEVNIHNVPNKYSFLPATWTMNNGVSENTMSLYKNDAAKPEDGVGEFATGKNFYMYENLQGKNNMGNSDPKIKTPKGLSIPTSTNDGIIDYTEWFEKWTTIPCTYIEVKGNYTIFTTEGKNNHVGDGPINYRFFLGEDAVSDFNIKRNTHYNVTLSFTGLAGKNELNYEWRVQADLEHATFYPKGTIVMDGTKGDFGKIPFFVLNGGTTGIVTFSTDGLSTSDMMIDYLTTGGYRMTESVPSIPKPIAENSYGDFGVQANNFGIISGPGQSSSDMRNHYRMNGTGEVVNKSLSENYTRRDDVSKGLIYRIRTFSISGNNVSEELEVKEYPLLFLGDNQNSCGVSSSGAIYSRRLDQPGINVLTLDKAKDACKHGEYVGEGLMYHYLPTKIELLKIISLEEAFPLTDGAQYWTTDGLFKVQSKGLLPVAGGSGLVRCIFRKN